MKKLFFFAAAATIALSSCVKNETVYTDAQEPIAFKAFAAASTKAPIDGTKLTGHNMAVFANYKTQAGAFNTYFENALFSEKGDTGIWGGDPKPYYWPVSGTMFFAAYSPWLPDASATYAETGEVETITINAIDNNKVDQDDVLFSNRTEGITCPQNNNVPLTLHHAFAQIVVNVKAKTANTAPAITLNKITLKDVTLGGKLVVTEGATSTAKWTSEASNVHDFIVNNNGNLEYAEDFELVKEDNDSYTSADTNYTGVLVVPSTQTSLEIVYTFNNGGKDQEITHTIDLANNPNGVNLWEMGKKYIYNITIGLNEITFEPKVDNWVDVTSNDITL